MAKTLKGTKTHGNLKEAFAGESQANRRYLYLARRADIEGYPDVGGLFRDTSEAQAANPPWPLMAPTHSPKNSRFVCCSWLSCPFTSRTSIFPFVSRTR